MSGYTRSAEHTGDAFNWNAMPLPKLPGMEYHLPLEQAKPLSQALNYKQGFMGVFEKPERQLPPRPNTADLFHHRSSAQQLSPPLGQRPLTGRGPSVQSPAPTWVAYDGKVLRYFAYFVEVVPMYGHQEHRMRRCAICFYLEDGTLSITEPKAANSGMFQGTFLKRHRVQNPATGGFVGILDLPVGGAITLYGRTFHILGCDPFTRAFLEREGLDVAPDMPYPETEEEHAAAAAAAAKAVKPRRNESAVERGEKARQWFSMDRKVLRFFCTFDEAPAAPGAPVERRSYVLHFFLADNTVEILEVVEKNSGRDPFPKLLSKQPLPKTAVAVGIKPMGVESRKALHVEYVRPVDLRIGATVNVFGRGLVIRDCDDFTRQYLVEVLNVPTAELEPVPPPPLAPPLPRPEVPPHNGYGNETDTEYNWNRLVPKPNPRTDFRRWEALDGKALRFAARFARSDQRQQLFDAERRFVVTFYLVDDSVSIFEPPVKNSGLSGGKFLDRTRGPVRKPGSRAAYKARDFFPGAVIEVACRQFELLEADERTANLQAAALGDLH